MDTVDIDALVIQARATARELNQILDKLQQAKCWVYVVAPPGAHKINSSSDLQRVELWFGFPAEGR